MWMAILLIWGMILGIQSATMTSQIEKEANAILKSGWWNVYPARFNISRRCYWPDISCNKDGSIYEINFKSYTFPYYGNFSALNLSVFHNLKYLNLSSLGLRGTVPIEIGLLSKLSHLDLSNNYLEGEIPHSIGNLKQLKHLGISNNKIEAFIPSLRNLTQLQELDISDNNIEGVILPELGLLNNLTRLEKIDISHNLLLGPLPSKMFPITYYKTSIDLSNNLISGEVTSQFGKFFELDLNNNNLTGTIPQSLCNVGYVNISYNCFKDLIPHCSNIYTKNKDGCINISINQFQPQLPHQRKNKVRHDIVIFLPTSIIIFFFFSVLICLKLRHCSIKNKHEITTTTKNGDLFCIWNYDGKIAYNDIIKATEDFDMRYCIGTGAYGSVYKADLPCGRVVALKKLHGYEAVQIPSFDESFRNEVKILSETKHRHIVKHYGFCLHKRIMFLIYQYMERGSLFSILYDDVEAMEFNWRKRVSDKRLSIPNNDIVLRDIIRVAAIAFACLNLNPSLRPTMKSVSQSFVIEFPPLSAPLNEISLQQLMSQELKAVFHIVNL